MCGEIGQVAASFFFSRTSFNRNTEKYFIATIAHQLAHSVPGLKEHINRAVEENPSILDRSLERQLQDLVLKPVKRLMEQLGDNRPAWPQVIIVDGLDECHGEDAQCLILDIISRLTTELPFCFLLASRPEAHIQEIFSDPQSHLGTISHDIFLDNSSSAADDIRLFLKSSFLEIRQKPRHRHSMRDIPPLWPSEQIIAKLVQKASGQFIYASTVIKFVDDPHCNPSQQLEIILGLSKSNKSTPFADLDVLYAYILSCSMNVEHTLQVLSVALILFTHTEGSPGADFDGPQTFLMMDRTLSFDDGYSLRLLRGLHSVVKVPEPHTGMPNCALAFYHASFPEYLMTESRSKQYKINLGRTHTLITSWCLNEMAWNMQDSGTLVDGKLAVWP